MHRLKTNSNIQIAFSEGEEAYLLQLVAQGDREAFSKLYVHYLPILYHYIYRFTKQSKEITEEILQDVFLIIWEKKEVLIAVNSFEKYVYTIAKNKLLNLLKHQDFKNKLHLNFSASKDLFESNTEKGILYDEYHKIALQAIDKLPEKRKEVFLLSTQGGLSLDEIASHLGISKSRVKQQLYSAKDYIKKYLTENAEWLLVLILLSK